MSEYPVSPDGEEGKFNAGIDTLKDISSIFKEIRFLSVRGHLPEYETILSLGKSQHIKYKLIKHLYIRALPLLKKDKTIDYRTEIKNQIAKVKLSWLPKGMGKRIDSDKNEAIPVGYYEAYNPQYDSLLDDIVMLISERLQDSGKYFMPGKEDTGL